MEDSSKGARSDSIEYREILPLDAHGYSLYVGGSFEKGCREGEGNEWEREKVNEREKECECECNSQQGEKRQTKK